MIAIIFLSFLPEVHTWFFSLKKGSELSLFDLEIFDHIIYDDMM